MATIFARYEILSLLGEGGMGAVYLARDTQLDRRIALKVLRGGEVSPQAKERMLREARMMAKLAHPNIVAVHDAGELEGQTFIAMEYVEGKTLATWLASPRTLLELLDAFQFCGQALAKAHELGIVHRDFKPDNVLVDASGRILVTDFGIATTSAADEAPVSDSPGVLLKPSSLTRTGTLIGTPAYMSPEQLRGLRVDASSDQFSFAVSLFEALYRQPPFAGESFEELRANVLGGNFAPLPPAARRRVPARIHRALERALARVPTQRFPGMNELLAEIAPPTGVRLPRWPLVAAAVVLAGGAGAFAVARGRRPVAAAGPLLAINAPRSIPKRREAISEFAFTLTATANGVTRDATREAHWQISVDAPANGKIDNEASPGHATFRGGGLYHVTATLGATSVTEAIDVHGSAVQYGVSWDGPESKEGLSEGGLARMRVGEGDVFAVGSEQHDFRVSTTLPPDAKHKRTVVSVGYVTTRDRRPAPFVRVENGGHHRIYEDHPLVPGRWYTFSVAPVGKRSDGAYDWEALIQPDDGPLLLRERFVAHTNAGERPTLVADIYQSDDACHATFDLLGEAPSARIGARWQRPAHVHAFTIFSSCNVGATAEAPPQVELRLPAPRPCLGCKIF